MNVVLSHKSLHAPLRVCPEARPSTLRRQVLVHSVMGGYQYNSRADALRSKGVEVKEFGSRTLREGCFGEDVLQLQGWLAEENYYNPQDGGYTGYFGSVTKEALQAWQHDHGLEASGSFDTASRWAYLSQSEARAAEATQAAQAVAHKAARAQVARSRAPSVAVATAQPHHAQPTAAGGAEATLLGAGLLLVGGAVLAIRSLRRKLSAAPGAARPTGVAAADARLQTFNEEHAAGEHGDAPYSPAAAGKSTLRRLSEDEIQRYLAPMKGEAPSRSPVQRPAPRPLHLSDEATAALPSKYGTYYGGRPVIDKVKQYLAAEEGPSTVVPSGPAQRMAALGYDMQRTAKQRAARAGATTQQSPPPVQRQRAQAERISPLTAAGRNGPAAANDGGSFRDVPDEQGAAAAARSTALAERPEALLAGTGLEEAPQRVGPPVRVQRPSAAPARPGPRSPAASPRPVAVVKPARAVAPATQSETDIVEPTGVLAAEAPMDFASIAAINPAATVVLDHKPIKLHKPARLAARMQHSDSEEAE